MTEKTYLPWNVQEVGRRVRNQLHVYEDRRSPLVAESHRLRTGIEKGTAQRNALASSVKVVENAGGDATALKTQVAGIDARLGPEIVRLAELDHEWNLLNAVCKWADMADSGLHWLVFAESELNKHDKTGVWAPDYHLRKKETV